MRFLSLFYFHEWMTDNIKNTAIIIIFFFAIVLQSSDYFLFVS